MTLFLVLSCDDSKHFGLSAHEYCCGDSTSESVDEILMFDFSNESY